MVYNEIQITDKRTSTASRRDPIALGFTVVLFCLLTVWPNAFVWAEGSKIVKWKDEKGITHYGDEIPAQYSNTENSIMNKQGVTIKRNKPVHVHEEAVNQEKLAQDKKDRALLAAFSHEDEIDLARDRNLQLDELALEGLQLQKTNQQKRHAELLKFAKVHQKKKQAIPDDLSADLESSAAEKQKINAQIEERKAMMAATRKRFDEDKARYMRLKGHATSEASQP